MRYDLKNIRHEKISEDERTVKKRAGGENVTRCMKFKLMKNEA